MQRILLCAFTAAVVLLAAGVAEASRLQLVSVQGGATWIEPRRGLLDGLGLELSAPNASYGDLDELKGPASWNHRRGQPRFNVQASSTLGFYLDGGLLSHFTNGELRHKGELLLEGPSGQVDLSDFVLAPGPRLDAMVLRRPGESEVLFTLDHGHVGYLAELGELISLNMDLRVAPSLAARLGRPEIAGRAIAIVHVRLRAPSMAAAPRISKAAAAPRLRADGTIDLDLYDVGFVEQYEREAGVRVAFGPGTAVKNVGTGGIPWFWTIAPSPNFAHELGQHPYLVYNAYRVAGGRFQELGGSDAKHAFYATNVICQPTPDTGQMLMPGCEDAYSTGNNSDGFHFGPRSEINPHTGEWQSLGSHFDGVPVDNERDHDVETDPYEHMLVVPESDLSTPGAEYYIEGWYVVQGDIDPMNNIGFRRICPRLHGGAWEFSCDPEPDFTHGLAIDTWGEQRNSISTSQGGLRIAVQTTPLGSGFYRYDYAVMNFDYGPGARAFSLPVDPGMTVRNMTFRDVDQEAGNDWQAVNTGTDLRWSSPDHPLNWGTVYNFSFEANQAPVSTVANLAASGEIGPRLQGATLGVRAGRVSTETPSPAPPLIVMLLALAALWPTRSASRQLWQQHVRHGQVEKESRRVDQGRDRRS